MSILGIIGALFVLGVLVFVHELGHFLAAKITGVKVLTFSIFMGKKLFTKKIGETEYAISAVPFGGYVKMLGQEDMPDPEANARLKGNPDEFPSKTVGQRIFIAFMGPLMNFLFAVFVLWIAFMLGVPEPVNPKGLYIGSVPENSPAGEAGIKVHDRIISVNGKEMNSWEDVYIEVVSGDGDSLPVKVLRRGDTLSFRVKPEYNDDLNQYFIEIGRYYPPV
ncbi:MAG: M50 family metallopeptidase, partial [Fibrobacterota bacterium]